MSDDHNLSPPPAWPEIIQKIRTRTPARIFVPPGAAYSTGMQLELRSAHARAVDAVWTEFDLHNEFPPDFVEEWKLFQVSSQAESKSQFLLRPDLGRKLSDAAKSLVSQNCRKSPDLQIVIGDGLSGAALWRGAHFIPAAASAGEYARLVIRPKFLRAKLPRWHHE